MVSKEFVITLYSSLILLFLLNVPYTLGESGSGGSMQFLNFYNSSDCSDGLIILLNSTEYNLTLSNASSMAVNGMWEVGLCEVNSSTGTCSSEPSIYISSVGYCVQIPKWLNDIQVQAIRYGDLYQSNGTIALFGSTQFTNVNPKSPVDTKGLNSTVPMNIQSWYFTGSHEWALYEGANYTGKETCLRPSDEIISRGYGFSYGLVTNLTINSVGYRCTGGTSGAGHLTGGIMSYFVIVLGLIIQCR